MKLAIINCGSVVVEEINLFIEYLVAMDDNSSFNRGTPLKLGPEVLKYWYNV